MRTSYLPAGDHLREPDIRVQVEIWNASDTAFVVCDMWGFHGTYMCVYACVNVWMLVRRLSWCVICGAFTVLRFVCVYVCGAVTGLECVYMYVCTYVGLSRYWYMCNMCVCRCVSV